ncbi:MAG: SIS domain-containing protein [Bryobacteraceae bacterium]|nr:SIS domain-containing protein [Bryobacteraceae bacterium]
MLREIHEQPAALERTLRGQRKGLAPSRPRLVVLAARGTSDNAAQFGRYLIETTTGIPVSLAAPSVYTLYRAKLDLRDTLVVGISQSGESTDVNMVVESAKAQGARTVAVTNESGSTLASLAHDTLLVEAGAEKSVAATKTYTGQLLSMYAIAASLGALIGEETLAPIPDLAARALTVEDRVRELAIRFHYAERALVIGRGLNYANAFEMALKLMETCYIVAERFSSADLLHGPIAMAERAFPAFLFAPSGATWPSISETTAKLEARGAETFLITDESNPAAPGTGIALPFAVEELLSPIPYIIPAQLLAAHLAAEKGLNPDAPRALSKVTRTV